MIRILWPGKTKNPELRRLIADYVQRIARLSNLELIETKEARGLREEAAERIKAKEACDLQSRLKNDFLVCLSDQGKEMTSEEFAQWLQRHLETNSRPLTFLIGGYAGIDDRLLRRADEVLSLSRMTMSHELSRLVLLEQVYRALTQMKGWPYAK